MRNPKDILRLAVSIFMCNSAGLIGSFFTLDSVRTWYPTLIKPALNPPAWVFGPIWTLLYTMMGIALFLVWSRHRGGKKRIRWLILFFIHLGLNALWSVLFFGYQMLFVAFIEICLLWLTLVALILIAFRFDRRVAYLLLPYLAWISFAGYLNYTLWQLNS